MAVNSSMVLQGMGLAGQDPSSLLLVLDQPRDRIEIGEDGWSLSTTYLTIYATWSQTLTALYGSAVNYGGLGLRKTTVEQIQDMGELALVTLYFDQRYSNTPTTPLPNSQHGVNADRKILPITLHPNFVGGAGSWDTAAPWSKFWDSSTKDWQADSSGKYLSTIPTYLYGWTQFPDAAATVWTKIYYESEPLDPLPEGKISDPGFGYGPSGCYLVASCDRAKENAFWCVTTHYEYFPRGVPTQIFQHG